jgi:hypothetical protein
MKKQYWAVGLNFDYDILIEEPNHCDYGSIDGPFATLLEAKLCVREWIRSDRYHLAIQLSEINSIKVKKHVRSSKNKA